MNLEPVHDAINILIEQTIVIAKAFWPVWMILAIGLITAAFVLK